MDDLTLVLGAKLARQLSSRTADELRQLLRVVIHQPTRHHRALRVDQIDRITGVERYTEPEFLPGNRANAPTYLLTFNPEKSYKWEDLQDCIDDVRDHGFYATAWSCGRNRRITAGDRVFMMRQGHGSRERRGIFASGWATSDVYEQEHWDETEARKGKLALYVPIRLDVLLDSDSEPILSRSVLREDPLAGGPWDARSGGVAIPDEIATELENVWARLLASKGIVPAHNSRSSRTL
jgi:hypothetical protein